MLVVVVFMFMDRVRRCGSVGGPAAIIPGRNGVINAGRKLLLLCSLVMVVFVPDVVVVVVAAAGVYGDGDSNDDGVFRAGVNTAELDAVVEVDVDVDFVRRTGEYGIML